MSKNVRVVVRWNETKFYEREMVLPKKKYEELKAQFDEVKDEKFFTCDESEGDAVYQALDLLPGNLEIPKETEIVLTELVARR